jgi:hypothetical protein
MESKEDELHKKTQELRSDFYRYFKKMKEDTKDFGKISRIDTQINNKLVEVLILNELAHEKKKLKKVI